MTKKKQSEMSHKSVENLRREIETRERKLEEGRHGKINKFQLWFYSSSSREILLARVYALVLNMAPHLKCIPLIQC